MLASSDPGFLLPFRASPPRMNAYLHFASWPKFDGSVSEPKEADAAPGKLKTQVVPCLKIWYQGKDV